MTDTAASFQQTHTDRLNHFIQHNLPLLVSMKVDIVHYDGKQFRVKMPLSSNHNDKGTAFGGSLYCLCIINAIGLAFLKSYEQGITPDLVVTRAEIAYLAPAKGENIIAEAIAPDLARWQQFFSDFKTQGKAKIALESQIMHNKKTCVKFTGDFALIGENTNE